MVVETIDTAATNHYTAADGTFLGYNIFIHDQAPVGVGALALASIPAGYAIRIKLNGAVFRNDLNVNGQLPNGNFSNWIGELANGGMGFDQAVYPVSETIPRYTFSAAVEDSDAASVSVSIPRDAIAVTSAEVGPVTITIQAYNNVFDAAAGDNPLSYSYFGGSGTLLEKVSGFEVSVSPGVSAVADAATGFRWFVGAAQPNTNTAVLGSFMARTNAVPIDLAVNSSPLTATTGQNFDENDVINSTRGLTLSVTGDLDIGAFFLTRTMDPAMANCGDSMSGTPETPLMGNLAIAMETPGMGTFTIDGSAGSESGTYTLCVNVDTMGAMSNMRALPVTRFMGAISRQNADAPLVSGEVGSIVRNGATAEVDLLTTAPEYNQRLIIVNYGARDVRITNVDFNAEGGAEAMLMDGLDLMIGAHERKVYLVSDMVEITGGTATAADIAFDGPPGVLSVVTTAVNREDSSTDTVMWPVN